jgi:iron complex outermembrane recepter protein
MKKIITLCLIVLGFHTVFGQKISGIVLLEDGKAAEFASVLLLNAKDSSIAKIAATDLEGKYEFFSMKKGDYLLNASYIGYEKSYGKVFKYDGSDFSVPLLKLMVSKNAELAQVNVVARKPLIEVQADKTILQTNLYECCGIGEFAQRTQFERHRSHRSHYESFGEIRCFWKCRNHQYSFEKE